MQKQINHSFNIRLHISPNQIGVGGGNGVSFCSILISHLADLPSANISSLCSALTFARLSFTYIPSPQPLPFLSLWPRHPGLGRKHHPASVPGVQPESLLEDVGRQHRYTARASVAQRLLRAFHRKQYVTRRPGPPQVTRTGSHQERVRFFRPQKRL